VKKKYSNTAFKTAVTQMENLGKELLIQRVSSCSKLNRCESTDDRRELEELYYNEIAATANVIRLFTGREISFQWQSNKERELYGGFALFEIAEDAPREKNFAGTPYIVYNRYSGKREEDRRADWGKGLEQGKIVKIYEYTYNKDENPCYVGGYLTPEFQTE
jgi:hypothetical protein